MTPVDPVSAANVIHLDRVRSPRDHLGLGEGGTPAGTAVIEARLRWQAAQILREVLRAPSLHDRAG